MHSSACASPGREPLNGEIDGYPAPTANGSCIINPVHRCFQWNQPPLGPAPGRGGWIGCPTEPPVEIIARGGHRACRTSDFHGIPIGRCPHTAFWEGFNRLPGDFRRGAKIRQAASRHRQGGTGFQPVTGEHARASRSLPGQFLPQAPVSPYPAAVSSRFNASTLQPFNLLHPYPLIRGQS